MERNPKAQNAPKEWREVRLAMKSRNVAASVMRDMDAIIARYSDANARQLAGINRLLAERQAVIERCTCGATNPPVLPVAGSPS